MSLELKLKPLQWSEPAKPDSGKTSYYDHVFADCPLGRVMITWKSWKEYDSYAVSWDSDAMSYFASGRTLEEAKALAQEQMLEKVRSILTMIEEMKDDGHRDQKTAGV
ncbi:hypothetical protein [Paraburkholderia sp. BCC1886]|uniref:hypothetical protein n=1 Tax=Paraburkholderia sp. BCC1886 TaxID=2562670 RepID=UPI0011832D28|nr:hypothetical protein [Paraburkholderia sp. BCC1886]